MDRLQELFVKIKNLTQEEWELLDYSDMLNYWNKHIHNPELHLLDHIRTNSYAIKEAMNIRHTLRRLYEGCEKENIEMINIECRKKYLFGLQKGERRAEEEKEYEKFWQSFEERTNNLRTENIYVTKIKVLKSELLISDEKIRKLERELEKVKREKETDLASIIGDIRNILLAQEERKENNTNLKRVEGKCKDLEELIEKLSEKSLKTDAKLKNLIVGKEL